ncbi:hypothetical protein BKA70DRAFT_1234954 [Coprinopsis sp. MPI-PUGE-AT-0042]|nr:hypothetical protein BKA70DRAFT_1234954 [Coprinopsis sp. MPI-PUGE-AT-0042]
MTSFAVQITRDKVIEKSKRAVEPSGGLHAALRKKGSQKIGWVDIGASRVAKIGEIQNAVRRWRCVCFGQWREGRISQRFCIDTVSSLNLARNSEARLLPLMKGLYFAHSASIDLIA